MIVRVFCLIIGLLLSVTASLQAQELDAAVTWSCQPQQGILRIHYYPSLANAKPEVKKEQPLVFYSLVNLDKDGTSVTGARSKKIVCQLKTDKLEITFEPGVPNVNLLGRCGAEITGLLSVKRNGRPLLTEEPFENLNCHERARRIDAVTIRDGSPKPEIRYGTYDE
jgi:hypothetical protein